MSSRNSSGLALALVFLALVVPPVQAQAPTAAEQELIALENQWAAAVQKGDLAALERLYADEYLAIDSKGNAYTKAEDLADVKSGAYKLTSFTFDEMKVRLHGEVAVVTGRHTSKATYKGADMSGTYRFTDVLIKRGGRWQVLTTQGTKVVTN